MRNIFRAISFFLTLVLCCVRGNAQVTNTLPGRSIVKLSPDYLRPVVYALNAPNASNAGTLLALNATNGAIEAEISVGINPTDMGLTPAGDFLYVINTGSRTISQVNLTTFAVQSTQPISTPSTYSLSNPLYIAADNYGNVYFTDGAWGPEVYSMNYSAGNETMILGTGGNEYPGAGGLVLSRDASTVYIWQQYGWSAGSANSSIVAYGLANNTLTGLTSGPNQNRDPLNTPIFLDGAQRWVFNKLQKVSATNTSVLLTQFTDNIYAISLDGSIAFGPTEVFNAQNGITITNLPFSSAVQTLSGDQKKWFRYNSAAGNLVIYDMAGIAQVSGTSPMPIPADGSIVSQAPTNLAWSPSATALSYDVYFGTDRTAVSNATTASPLYLGRAANETIALPQPLTAGTTYYWRLDMNGFAATNHGPVWSFTVPSITFTPTMIAVGSIVAYNPASTSITLSSAAPAPWSAVVTGGSWLSLSASNGVTDATINVSYNTASFSIGTYTNNIEFTTGGLKVEIPVTLNVAAMNVVKMAADKVRPYIYAIQPPVLSGQNGTLLFINTLTSNIDKSFPIGINPTDLSINYGEGRLYIASWGEAATYVVDLNVQTLLPTLDLGTDVYKINAGRAGRVITEGEDQWVSGTVIDTTTGVSVGSFGILREGDGEMSPDGSTYYHCDNNISDANVHKYIFQGDSPSQVAASNEHPYGTRNLVLSPDGTRLFWNSYEYDTNLNELGTLGTEIYSCNRDGSVAFGGSQAIDGTTRLVIYNLPVSSSISVVDGQNQNFWYYNSAAGTLGSVPMSVIESPSITQQPATNTGVRIGSAVYLTVSAMGLGPLTYQWTFSGTNLPGATNYFLSLPSLQTPQQGSYQVIVANSTGTVTSTVATVTALLPPAITNQSQSMHVLAGQPISLFVSASGTAPLSYQWLFQNSIIRGATTSTLTITNSQESNEGIYVVFVTNQVGSVTSAVVSVRVDPAAPAIISNPPSLILPASSNAAFSVTAIGSQPMGYQWYFNNTPVAGANSAQLSLAGIQSSNGGNYYVVVSNSLGSATSGVATLTVTPLAPYFTLQPQSAAVSGGSSRVFSGSANGSQPISYQWQHNGTNIPGATLTALSITNIAYSDSGFYILIASNAAGTTASSPAQLTVFQLPTLTVALTNEVVDAGSNVLLSASIAGTPPLAFSWRLNGKTISDTNSTLALPNIQPAQSGYYSVTVTNAYGNVSSTGRVSVLAPMSSVIGWGDNSGGQLDVPANLADIVAVASGDYHALALHHDGTLTAWGYDGNGQTNVPTNAQMFVSIASGADHCLAITATGSLVAWGRNDAGQCQIPAAASNNVLSVAAGDSHSLAVTSTGSVVAWGDNSFGQTSVPPGLAGIAAVAAGREHNLALRTNGTVVGWGYNGYGQAAAPAGLSNVIGIAAGYLHSAALLSNSTVVVWGDDSFGQTNIPAGLTNVVAIAAGDFDTYALLASGQVMAWGDDTYGQTNVPTLGNAVGIATGYDDGFALVPGLGMLSVHLTRDGILINWNGNGKLQWAPFPSGPFSDVPVTGNTFTNTDMSSVAKFFRLRH